MLRCGSLRPTGAARWLPLTRRPVQAHVEPAGLVLRFSNSTATRGAPTSKGNQSESWKSLRHEERKIGLAGVEPATPCTPSKYAKPTALQPDFDLQSTTTAGACQVGRLDAAAALMPRSRSCTFSP